jgi:parallel beta-helix repeat protein
MRWNTAASLLVLVLLSSPILLSVSFGFAKVADLPSAYIRADGTVEGTSSIQRNGDVYTFVGNSTGTLYVEKDNIMIDGAGYTLVGGRNRGIVLADRQGVTLKNARVEVDVGYIVNLDDAKNCVLVGNTFVGTPKSIADLPAPSTLIGPIGIHLQNAQGITIKDNVVENFFYALALDCSSGHTITGNTFSNGMIGLELSDTTNCFFRDNRLINCSFGLSVFRGYGYENDLDASNTIDGKPIYYLVGHKDEAVPQDAAYVVLVDCENMKVKNLTPKGIVLVSTKNSVVSRVKMVGNGNGVRLLDCTGIIVSDSFLCDHAVGIDLEGSSNNTISHNYFANYITSAIRFAGGRDNVFSGNTFFNNTIAIAPVHDSVPFGYVIDSNNFTLNDWAITVHGSMKIQGNVFEENEYAIVFSSGSGSVVTENTFANNDNALYFSDASNNNINRNNFVDNAHHVTDAGLSNQMSLLPPAQATSGSVGSVQLVANFKSVNFFPPPPPSTNNWDNGKEGNYWSDYEGLDSTGDGIGDSAYQLYENNRDRYPLMEPVAISAVPSPPDESSFSTPPVSSSNQKTESTQSSNAQAQPEFTLVIIIVIVVALSTVVSLGVVIQYKKRNHRVEPV